MPAPRAKSRTTGSAAPSATEVAGGELHQVPRGVVDVEVERRPSRGAAPPRRRPSAPRSSPRRAAAAGRRCGSPPPAARPPRAGAAARRRRSRPARRATSAGGSRRCRIGRHPGRARDLEVERVERHQAGPRRGRRGHRRRASAPDRRAAPARRRASSSLTRRPPPARRRAELPGDGVHRAWKLASTMLAETPTVDQRRPWPSLLSISTRVTASVPPQVIRTRKSTSRMSAMIGLVGSEVLAQRAGERVHRALVGVGDGVVALAARS